MTEKIITAEQAKEVLQKEKLERAERCNAKIVKELEEENCRINAIPFINAEGRILVQVDIVAL